MKAGTGPLKEYVAEHYKGVDWKWKQVVKDMFAANDFYGSEIVQVKTPTLSKRRFVLVGDAVYAPGPTGGGASLAMAGAYLLAGEIIKHNGYLAAGFRGFEQQVRPLINDLQKILPLVPTAFAPQTAWRIWLRTMIFFFFFSFICWSRILEFFQKVFQWLIQSH